MAILVPVLNRPHRVGPLIDSIEASTTVPWRVVLIACRNYNAELKACRVAVGQRPDRVQLEVVKHTAVGDYARKINLGVQITDEPYLFLGADDLEFRPGWFEAAVAALDAAQAGVCGVDDMGPITPGSPHRADVAAGLSATHSLVARWYAEFGTIDEAGKLLHEGYPHEFVDDEFCATARYRGAWTTAPDAHVLHMKPNLGDWPTDQSYDLAPGRISAGRKVYRRRAHLWDETPPRR